MFVLVWSLMLLVMMNDVASAKIITAHSGEAVLLTLDLQGAVLEPRHDVRWTHLHLVVSLKNNVTTCHHRRCELLRNGSLRFSQVQTADAGNYSLEVFDEGGKRLMRRDFLLRVEEISSSSVMVSALSCCFFLVLFFIIFFILHHRTRTAGQLQENVYVMMHRGNKKKDEEEKNPERENKSNYVPSNPVVSMETPITQQIYIEAEDIYV